MRCAAMSPNTRLRSASISQRRFCATNRISRANAISPLTRTSCHALLSAASMRSVIPGVSVKPASAALAVVESSTSPEARIASVTANGARLKRAVLPANGLSRSRAHDALRSRWLIAAATGGARIAASPAPASAASCAGPDIWIGSVLLDAADQPAGVAVDRLLEVPHLAERLGCAVGAFADRAAEAHARDISPALGHHFQHFGVERHDIGFLRRGFSLDLRCDLGIQLGSHEIAQGRHITLIVGRLQPREIELGMVPVS